MQSSTFLRKNTFYIVPLTLAFVALFSSCKKESDDSPPDEDPQGTVTVNYSGTFGKSSTDVSTSGSGTVTGVFNTTTRELSYTMNWSGLSSNPTNMHFHSGAPVIMDIEGFTAAVSGTLEKKAM